jgi:hypothetical protein
MLYLCIVIECISHSYIIIFQIEVHPWDAINILWLYSMNQPLFLFRK